MIVHQKCHFCLFLKVVCNKLKAVNIVNYSHTFPPGCAAPSHRQSGNNRPRAGRDWSGHPGARAIGFHTKIFKKLDTKTKKGPPNGFLRALLLLKWINMVNSNPLKE